MNCQTLAFISHFTRFKLVSMTVSIEIYNKNKKKQNKNFEAIKQNKAMKQIRTTHWNKRSSSNLHLNNLYLNFFPTGRA